MRIQIFTDAWEPQVNGVVRTLRAVRAELEAMGHEIDVVAPGQFRTVPCPSYPEIRLAWGAPFRLARRLRDFGAQALHVATEGPIGFAARRACLRARLPFTTAYHTRFPEYLRARAPLPLAWTYALLRHFHAPAQATMVATPHLRRELDARGFGHLALWGRGVDLELFRPRPGVRLEGAPPIHLFVGRVAVEKNVEAYLALDLPGTKYVVGDGPALGALRKKYPTVRFAGARHGEDLARHYAGADLFVFPSLTDTYGLVLLEALASGLPVAAYPVAGPRDVITDSAAGCLDADLGRAARMAASLSSADCRAFAERHSWRASAEQFLANLAVFGADGAVQEAATASPGRTVPPATTRA